MPGNVYLFCKELGIEETAFYDQFASLESLQDAIFTTWFKEVTQSISSNELYDGYNAREKFLAFLFAWFEARKANRSFILFLHQQHKQPSLQGPLPYLKQLKQDFLNWINPLLKDGMGAKEIEYRKFIGDKYGDALWLNFLFVHDFWLKDRSPGFEKTDEAIERSVNLGFDLMGKSPLDSMLSFGKFLFQNR